MSSMNPHTSNPAGDVYKIMFDQAPDAMFIIDSDDTVREVNAAACALTGFTLQELAGLPLVNLFAGTAVANGPAHDHTLAERPAAHREQQLRKKDGSVITVETGMCQLPGGQRYAIVRDVTAFKAAQLRLLAAIEEKETLLKEVHHRVKNNLQIVSSLLNLQASEINDETLFEMFKESQNRIQSLALLHEKLYQTRNLAQVDFLDYLQSMTMQLGRSYERSGVTWQVDGDPVILGVDQAIPCGLIVNELVSNAMKHAFVGRERGNLTVGFHSVPDGKVELRVQDDGIGFPEGVDFRNLESMGMVLVMSLVEQIDASITLDRTGGSLFTVRFTPHP